MSAGAPAPSRRQVAAGLLGVGLLAALPGCGEPTATAYRADPLPLDWVVVRLPVGDDRPGFEVDGRWEALDRLGARRASGGAGSHVVCLGAEGLDVGGESTSARLLDVRPLGGALLSFGGRRYRGLLRFESDGKGILLVLNRLPVDDYLRGVVPDEMPDRFGIAALSAQTVAARTYALAEMRRRAWLHADVRSQVYGGRDAETWLCDRAVEATRGQVLTSPGGEVFSAWFHSTCGGETVPARRVFPNAPAGVLERATPCEACSGSPTWAWTRELDAGRVCQAAGLPPARLESVRALPDRFPGRPERVRVQAGGRSAEVDAERFRREASAGQALSGQLLSTRWARPARIEQRALIIEGRGWGHGVGLCQYGAAGRARAGAGYAEILAHYYDGARLVRLVTT